jgi:glycosyltransferase domain-containing protein
MTKVALLVPTLNRIDFVIRLINYYASINSPHPIFIGDASSQSSKDLVIKAAQDKLDIYYYHWEKLNDRKTMIKLAEKAQSANVSNYCVFSGDDDFFVLESLSKCAEFLDENLEYATAQGRAFIFKLNKDGPYGDLQIINIYWDKKELHGETALERINEITSNYWVPNFSVHRINEFKDDISNGVDKIVDKMCGEYANSITFAMRGKSKFIDCLYFARNVHSSIDHLSRGDWIKNEDFELSYIELINSVSEILSRNHNLSLDDSNLKAKFSVEKLFAPIFIPENSKYLFIRKFIKKHFINNKGMIYSIYIFYRWMQLKSIYFLPSSGFSRKSLLSRKSKYYKDVYSIIHSCEKK